MSYMLFSCHGCKNVLALESEYMGSEIECPHCEAQITVPQADNDFFCPACSEESFIPDDLGETSVACPHCDRRIITPAIEPKVEPTKPRGLFNSNNEVNVAPTPAPSINENVNTQPVAVDPPLEPQPTEPAPVSVPKEKPRLGVQRTFIHADAAPTNPAVLARYGGIPQPPSAREKMMDSFMSFAKLVIVLALLIGLGVGYFYFFNYEKGKEGVAMLRSHMPNNIPSGAETTQEVLPDEGVLPLENEAEDTVAANMPESEFSFEAESGAVFSFDSESGPEVQSGAEVQPGAEFSFEAEPGNDMEERLNEVMAMQKLIKLPQELPNGRGKVIRLEPDGIHVRGSTGIRKMGMEKMLKDQREKYHIYEDSGEYYRGMMELKRTPAAIDINKLAAEK